MIGFSREKPDGGGGSYLSGGGGRADRASDIAARVWGGGAGGGVGPRLIISGRVVSGSGTARLGRCTFFVNNPDAEKQIKEILNGVQKS